MDGSHTYKFSSNHSHECEIHASPFLLVLQHRTQPPTESNLSSAITPTLKDDIPIPPAAQFKYIGVSS